MSNIIDYFRMLLLVFIAHPILSFCTILIIISIMLYREGVQWNDGYEEARRIYNLPISSVYKSQKED